MDYNNSSNVTWETEDFNQDQATPLAAVFLYIHTAVVLSGFIINTSHAYFLAQVNFVVGQHFRAYLFAIAVDDAIAFLLRVLSNNEPVQMWYQQEKLLCAFSAVLHQILMFAHMTLFVVISCDRANVFIKPVTYSSTFLIKHWKIAIILGHIVPAVIFIGYGAIVYNRGFYPARMGPCKLDSPTAPYLTIPPFFAGLVLLLIITGNCIYILIKQKRIYAQMSGQALEIAQQRAAEVNKSISLVLLLKYSSWLPLLIWVVVRSKARQCLVCEWALSEVSAVFNVMFPFVYGLRTTEYRTYLTEKFKCCWTCNKVQDRKGNQPVSSTAKSIATVCEAVSTANCP